jgi:transposase
MNLTMKEEHRINVIQRVMDEQMTRQQAGEVLERSERQIYRLLNKARGVGIQGLIHGNRGRESPRKKPEGFWKKVLEIVRKRYRDVNDRHLQELLEREEKIRVGRESLRKCLRTAGIAPKRKRRGAKYRKRRERKDAFGRMIQIDGSPHDWLEGRGPWLTLVGGKDDATGHVWARFEEAESTWAYFRLAEQILARHGIPMSFYSDRHTIFFSPREPTIVEQLQDRTPVTQFGRAMQELGITLIPAYSPQAKGRIERNWGIFQDRLVVELRLANVKTREEANRVLERFLEDFNRRFTVPAKNREAVFRKIPRQDGLDRILCLKETRTVAKDHTVSFEGLILQIPALKRSWSIAGRSVDVLQLKDGSIEIVHKGKSVAKFSPEAVTRLVEQKKPMKSQLKTAA